MTQEVSAKNAKDRCKCGQSKNGDSAVLFGSADKVTGICTEFTEFFWTFSIVLYSKKRNVSETGSVSVLR
jgi:hypothetical protein